MKVILLSIIGALILLWGALITLFKAADTEKFSFAEREGEFLKLQTEYFWGLGIYVTVLTAVFIYLVLETSLARQESALENTQGRFYEQMDALRDNFGKQTEKLMGQLEEKAELTGSEIEIRQKLRAELDQHKRTREQLENTQVELQNTQIELLKEVDAHGQYLDRFNTEQALHQQTRTRLSDLNTQNAKTQNDLRDTRGDLNRSRERLAVQKGQIDKFENTLKSAQKNAQEALANSKRLFKEADNHQEGLILLQATVDSIFKKVLKRPRVPDPEPEAGK